MRILVTGSIAYDTLLHYGQKFNQHLLPEHLDNLSIAFVMDRIEKRFGGCAGNIAFHSKMLKLPVLPVGVVGKDFSEYQSWLSRFSVPMDCIKIFDDCYTAQAIVSSDVQNNQITFFYPGAMKRAGEYQLDLSDILGVGLGFVSPNDKLAMLYFADQFFKHNVPFVFDPGQAISLFECSELLSCIEKSSYLIVNEYEFHLLKEKTNQSLEQMICQLKGLIITRGDQGADLYVNEGVQHFQAISVGQAVDPTGCGDAFRAGLLYGLYHECSWQKTMQLATLLGGINASYHGTQSDQFDYQKISAYFFKNFGTYLSE